MAEGAAAGNEPPNAEWPIKDRDGYLTVSRLLPAPACWQCRLRASIVRPNSMVSPRDGARRCAAMSKGLVIAQIQTHILRAMVATLGESC